MATESLELADKVETPKNTKLDEFNYLDYENYFPQEHEKFLTDMLSTRAYGWKSRARVLMDIGRVSHQLEGLHADLIARCNGSRKSYTRLIEPRDGLRAFLTSLDDEKLGRVCYEQSVDYNSFMKSNDRIGLVEAIIDEMLA